MKKRWIHLVSAFAMALAIIVGPTADIHLVALESFATETVDAPHINTPPSSTNTSDYNDDEPLDPPRPKTQKTIK